VPGHCTGHITLLDEQAGNLFVGDAIDDKLGDPTFIPPVQAPSLAPRRFSGEHRPMFARSRCRTPDYLPCSVFRLAVQCRRLLCGQSAACA
jgi:hypothetical protein